MEMVIKNIDDENNVHDLNSIDDINSLDDIDPIDGIDRLEIPNDIQDLETLNEPTTENNSKKSAIKTLAPIVLIIAIFIGIFATYNYIYNQHPDIYKDIKFKLDKVGLAPKSPQEIERKIQINKLPISYEEKQILLNKTIFMGAEPYMVKLALGKPKRQNQKLSEDSKTKIITFLYHLPEEKLPTMLEFKGDKLVRAYKGSYIDFDNTPINYTGSNSE